MRLTLSPAGGHELHWLLHPPCPALDFQVLHHWPLDKRNGDQVRVDECPSWSLRSGITQMGHQGGAGLWALCAPLAVPPTSGFKFTPTPSGCAAAGAGWPRPVRTVGRSNWTRWATCSTSAASFKLNWSRVWGRRKPNCTFLTEF
jgi:hypothetical protein